VAVEGMLIVVHALRQLLEVILSSLFYSELNIVHVGYLIKSPILALVLALSMIVSRKLGSSVLRIVAPERGEVPG
jgi:hypothetical protein